MRSGLWFVAGLGLGVVSTLNGCAYFFRGPNDCKTSPTETVLTALEAAKSRLQTAMAEAQRSHKAVNVVAPSSCTPCAICPEPPFRAAAAAQTVEIKREESCSPSSKRKLFLVGLVMHVERSQENYLEGTLKSLASSQLGMSAKVMGLDSLVVVYDASPRPSENFAAAKKRFGSQRLFRFDRNNRTTTHSIEKPSRLKAKGATRQARDVAAALRWLLLTTPDFGYALLLEDDWLACKGLLSSVILALEAATEAFGDDVSAIRVSYGLNGVLVPRRHLNGLADFIDARATETPPDHSFTAWALATGTLVTFRHNAFVHVGSRSSIGNAPKRWNAACYELLFDWLHRDTEAFQIKDCAHDLISPCLPKTSLLLRNPKPDRRNKDFPCELALQDMPAYRASQRLIHCLQTTYHGQNHKATALINDFQHHQQP